jgi:hypothetical protein
MGRGNRFSNAERTKVSVNSVAEGDDCPGTLTYLFLCSLVWSETRPGCSIRCSRASFPFLSCGRHGM